MESQGTELNSSVSRLGSKDFQTFIYKLLQNFVQVKEKNELIEYVKPNSMNLWAKAFTHESVSPTFNYEELEIRGDAILKLAFPNYLMKRFPGIKKGAVTDLNNLYFSKKNQAQISNRLGFIPFIYSTAISIHVREDIMESFVGALWEVSLIIPNGSEGRAFTNCSNFVTYLFKDVKIDTESAFPKKTFVEQTLSRLGLDVLKVVPISEGGVRVSKVRGPDGRPIETQQNFSYELQMTGRNIKFFEQFGVYLTQVLGVGTGSTKNAALRNAYESAANNLNREGVTSEWAGQLKREIEFNDPIFAPYIDGARANLRKRGFDTMMFSTPSTTVGRDAKTINLIGINTTNNQQVILYSVTTNDTLEGKKELLQRLDNNV